MVKIMGRPRKNYLDKELFRLQIVEFQKTYVGFGVKLPISLCTSFRKLVEKITARKEFRNYPQDIQKDMQSEAMIHCILALNKFDTSRNNPHSYFTTTIINAFLQCLKKMYAIENHKMEMMQEEYHRKNLKFDNTRQNVVEECHKEKHYSNEDY
jgi:DNA-directed RNA polymerase specialized sigma subunit